MRCDTFINPQREDYVGRTATDNIRNKTVNNRMKQATQKKPLRLTVLTAICMKQNLKNQQANILTAQMTF